jgi:hypothetical protein
VPRATGFQPRKIARSRLATGARCDASSKARDKRVALAAHFKTSISTKAQALAASLRRNQRVSNTPQRRHRLVTLPPHLAGNTRRGRHERAAAKGMAARATTTGASTAGVAGARGAQHTRQYTHRRTETQKHTCSKA